jgi:predicted lipase
MDFVALNVIFQVVLIIGTLCGICGTFAGIYFGCKYTLLNEKEFALKYPDFVKTRTKKYYITKETPV